MLRYLREAFFLRWPLGALGDIPVNAVAVATVAVVGFFHPGFWFLGAGIEAAYICAAKDNEQEKLWPFHPSGGCAVAWNAQY